MELAPGANEQSSLPSLGSSFQGRRLPAFTAPVPLVSKYKDLAFVGSVLALGFCEVLCLFFTFVLCVLEEDLRRVGSRRAKVYLHTFGALKLGINRYKSDQEKNS